MANLPIQTLGNTQPLHLALPHNYMYTYIYTMYIMYTHTWYTQTCCRRNHYRHQSSWYSKLMFFPILAQLPGTCAMSLAVRIARKNDASMLKQMLMASLPGLWTFAPYCSCTGEKWVSLIKLIPSCRHTKTIVGFLTYYLKAIQILHYWRSQQQSTNATRPCGYDIHSKYCLLFLMYTSDLRSIPV